ncbi:hypothetical protein EJB05_16374, partial [Eragrostis curvula]
MRPRGKFWPWWRKAAWRVQKQHRKGFNPIVILTAWLLWKHRNYFVFNSVSPSAATVVGQAGRERQSRGWELKYTRQRFFPYWRSILSPRLVRIMPQMLSLEQIDNIRNESVGKGFSPISNHDLDLVGRFPQLRSYQPVRLFGAAGALSILKMLKNA